MIKMNFSVVSHKDVPDVKIVTPKVFGDSRWSFCVTYSEEQFSKLWISDRFVQDNESLSQSWVLRWLHFQTQDVQAKLVRVLSWKVVDVVVDLRKWSPTFGKHIMEILDAKFPKMLFIPRWFAHWFLTLEDDTVFSYKCDNRYNPQAEWWILWNCPELWINWHPFLKQLWLNEEWPILSPKDMTWPLFAEFKKVNPF